MKKLLIIFSFVFIAVGGANAKGKFQYLELIKIVKKLMSF
ncbi:hypothetical protein BHWA1_01655 [Brachyspira hyodysenteriae WA1]|uniref:Uncharacterized protein n=1 Tax=Brachyspira hyodysenteriae (strain ATCC 49526 / WA1) TaxID=565034 RepID=A0A3B6V9M2_BRAHW|nr:hypothetical protein BHWA1_01655 [Brachyspira hyodysenteriae WA1]